MQGDFPVLISSRPLNAEFQHLNEIKLTTQEFSLGRGLNNSVLISYIYISRNHCIFKKQQHGWILHDSSTCGIEVNGIKMGKGATQKLVSNDIITLEPSKQFEYKFFWDVDCPPWPKRIKLEVITIADDINLKDVKAKFEELQNIDIKRLEDNIYTQKKIQETCKQLLNIHHQSLNRKLDQLKNDFALKIKNLKGKKGRNQKSLLLSEQNKEVTTLKKDMGKIIQDVSDQIQKHNEMESMLVIENNSLKKKLLKEREDFLLEFNKENSPKQDLYEKLQKDIKKKEELRLNEKMELEKLLKKELEELRLAKQKELNELPEEQRQRELELMELHNNVKENLQKQIEITEKQKKESEQQLSNQMEQMKKISDKDKMKMDHLVQEREEIQKKLLAANEDAKKLVEDLKSRVETREVQLAALAAERIHQQSKQSGEVIISLQEQLEKVKNQLESVQREKEKLLKNVTVKTEQNAGPSKENMLVEVGEIMESELQCSICSELFVTATTLNCSHTFCKCCITKWKKKKRECPICRTPISSECRSIVLDSFIDKMVQNLTDEMKKKREEMLKSREEDERKLERPSTGSSRGSSSESEWDESDYAPLEGERQETSSHVEDVYDDYDDCLFSIFFGFSRYSCYNSYSGSDFDTNTNTDQPDQNNGTTAGNSSGTRRGQRGAGAGGAPRAYYGGYGRCYRCGARGHWAPGCPRQ